MFSQVSVSHSAWGYGGEGRGFHMTITHDALEHGIYSLTSPLNLGPWYLPPATDIW